MKVNHFSFIDDLKDCENRFDLWEAIIKEACAGTFAEIGVWKGEFAAHQLAKLEIISRYYMIDPWANLPDWNKPANVRADQFDAIYNEAMTRTAFAARKLRVLRGRTKDVIDKIPDESLDAAYIDGDHTLRGISIDLIKIAPKIKPGGYFGGDDFVPTPWQHTADFEPTLVCPFSVYFAEAMGYPIVALPFNQFLIRKVSGEEFSFSDITGNYSDLSLNRLDRSGQRYVVQAKHGARKLAKMLKLSRC